MGTLTPEDQKKQELYRDARFLDQYDQIWQSVGKCVFCDLKDKYIIFEENGIVLTISLYAYIDGHCMIVPRRHVKSSKELTASEWETVRKFKYIAKKLVKDVHRIRGMQFVQKDGAEAQSTVEHHLHFHCIPFDAPDLLEWNYRKLQYTPLENTEKYRQARKKIVTTGGKFSKKYEQPDSLPVYCDVFIISTDKKVLFQERKKPYKLHPDYLTPVGGKVDSFAGSLESELVREIKEETGMTVPESHLRLFASQIDRFDRAISSKPLQARYVARTTFLRNTYILRDVDSKKTTLVAGDDAESLVWVAVKDIPTHSRITETTKKLVEKMQEIKTHV